MDVDGDSGDPADAQANYIEVARTSIDKALQDAGIEGISVSVSEDNANEILFSPVLEIENAITTDTSTVPTVTVSDGKITLEGYFSSGDQIDFDDACAQRPGASYCVRCTDSSRSCGFNGYSNQ